MRRRRPLILLPVAALLGAFAFPPAAHAAETTLPGGTSISVEIGTPVEGALLPPGPVTITGSASIGRGVPVRNTGLVYVLDVSGSTTSTGCAGGDIRTCEVAAAKQLNDGAATSGTVNKVGVVVFADSARFADLGPSVADDLDVTPPEARTGVGERHVTTVLNSVFNDSGGGVGQFIRKTVGTNTDYLPAIRVATTTAMDTGATNRIVVFMSDGLNGGGPIADALKDARDNRVVFKTFAIGNNSTVTCGDANGNTLERIARETGGPDAHCVPVTDLSKLPDLVPGVIESRLTALSLTVDGGPDIPVTNVNKPLPLTGPDDLTYSVTTNILAPGAHQVCVRADGSDGGGSDHVTDCRTIRINAPPVVDAGGPYTGNEDNQVAIAGTVTDPDGPPATAAWSVVPVSGVPPGSTCTFANPAALSTTVSCTERGTYRLTLTATDGLHPPVSDTAELTLRNVAPTVSAGGPYTGNEDNPVAIAGTVTDPDGPTPITTTWTIVPTGTTPPGAICTFGNPATLTTTVNCTEHGSYELTLTASDGVNLPVSATAALTLNNVAPTASPGGPYLGEEDHPVAIIGRVTDPDSPGLTTTWTVTPNAGVTPGVVCSFANPAALSTVVTCSEPGSYTLTLTVDDKVNPPAVVRTTMTLSLTPGALSLITTVSPAPGFVGGDQVVVTHTVHNAGPAAMSGVRLSTTLPAGLTPSSVSRADCASACDLGTLAPGATVQVRFSFTPTAALDLPVTAAVTTSGPDIDQADNAGSVRVVIRQPVLAVDPLAGPTGFVTHATGRDFPPGARIRLQWSVGISETPGELTVRPDGTLDGRVLIFPKDTKGMRNLQAIFVSGARFGPITSNPFLVTPRSLKPLNFVVR